MIPKTNEALISYNNRIYTEFDINKVISDVDNRYGAHDNFDPREEDSVYDNLLHRISYEYLNLNVPYEALAPGRTDAETGLLTFRFMLSRKFIRISTYEHVFAHYVKNRRMRPLPESILDRINSIESMGESYSYSDPSVPFWDLADPRSDSEHELFRLRWIEYCEMVHCLGGYIYGTHVYGEYANSGMSIG